MSKASTLSRQLAFSMVAMTMAIMVLTFIGFYLLFWLLINFAPELLPPQNTYLPGGTDLVMFLILSLLGGGIAIRTAFRMSVRIVSPVSEVALAARRVAAGDLTARAAPGDRSLGETAKLVDDFNIMAARLEKMAGNVVNWNAQIAHELRTPLTILKGRLQGVSDGVFMADETLIHSLTKQVDGLSRLVEDLRVVSLFDSGHLVLDRQDVDLAHEIHELATFVRPELERAGFSLQLALAPGKWALDPIRIRQALMALIDNARCHADPGPIRIMLDIDANRARITVSDAGPGLSSDFAGQAFDLFSREERTKPSTHGSGLGLAVVRAILHAHHGSAEYDLFQRAFILEVPAS